MRLLASLAAVVLAAAACNGSESEPTVGDSAVEATSATTVAITEGSADSEIESLAAGCEERMALFEPFLAQLTVACDDTYIYVDAEGLSTNEMMVGITAWNQQVPLPQPYSGSNAWRIPLTPIAASQSTATNGQGAIGMALDGVPIFDPTQQDGVYAIDRDPFRIGELDGCGGHAGRGDDYHYHSGPVCVVEQLSDDGEAVGFALDGFIILGFHENGGIEPEGLDECNGHDHDGLGYHYHLVEAFPYVLGCYNGEVDISIQPRAHPVRSDGTPIQVEITAYTVDSGTTRLEYLYEGAERSVSWTRDDEMCFTFTYVDPPQGSPGTGTETACRAG